MATFVVRFLKVSAEDFLGMVRHVATGEEVSFSSQAELLAFFEEMRALGSIVGTEEDPGGREGPGKR